MGDAPKITMVGAGGMSFGPTMANDVIHTRSLRGARLMLHDLNPERLERAYQFANKLNAASGSPILIDRSTDAEAALSRSDRVWMTSFAIVGPNDIPPAPTIVIFGASRMPASYSVPLTQIDVRFPTLVMSSMTR